MAPPNHTNTIGSIYWMSALVNDIVVVLADDPVIITSGVFVLLGDSCVVKKSSSSFILTFGSYSVVSGSKSPDPEPLPASISSAKIKRH